MTSERVRFARSLRQQQTRAEDILWQCLRGSRFEGAKLKRQVPLDRYVADFYCHAARLVVELDGEQVLRRIRDELRLPFV
jgi:very-short-patch-repair endonuclease